MRDVSIVKCTSYDPRKLLEAVEQSVLLLGGIERFIKRSDRVLVKPNILAGKTADSGVTTHPAILGAILTIIKETGATPVVGDSSALGNTVKNAKRTGLKAVCDKFGVAFVELKTPVTLKNPNAKLFKRLEVAKEAIECDAIINLPKMKTHAQMFMTMGVKNLFGCIPGKRKVQWHLSAGIDTASFATMLLDLHTLLAPRLNILDAVISMEGNGPASGELRATNFIMASADAVSMDRVALEVLGASTDKMPLMKVACAIEPKLKDISNINILGESVAAVRIKDFKFPPLVDIDFSSILPYFIAKRVKKALTSRPVVDNSNCALCNVCASLCPAEAMKMTTRIVIDYDNCIRCYCCQESCPQGVISAKAGWLKRLIPSL